MSRAVAEADLTRWMYTTRNSREPRAVEADCDELQGPVWQPDRIYSVRLRIRHETERSACNIGQHVWLESADESCRFQQRWDRTGSAIMTLACDRRSE